MNDFHASIIKLKYLLHKNIRDLVLVNFVKLFYSQ